MDFKEPLSDVQDSTDEDETEFTDTGSQGSVPIVITKIDINQGRPVDELPFSLQKATNLCEIEPLNTAAQEASTLSLLVKAADAAGEVLPVPFQLPLFGMRGYEEVRDLKDSLRSCHIIQLSTRRVQFLSAASEG